MLVVLSESLPPAGRQGTLLETLELHVHRFRVINFVRGVDCRCNALATTALR